MTSFVPKLARKILSDPKLQREYFLKPYGLEVNSIQQKIPKNSRFPRQHPEYKFFQHKIILHRPGKEVNDNVLTFKCDQNLSKPEIKQYLQKLYNLNIQKVNTVRYMGKVKRNPNGEPIVTKNFKRVYAITGHKIDPVLNGVICE